MPKVIGRKVKVNHCVNKSVPVGNDWCLYRGEIVTIVGVGPNRQLRLLKKNGVTDDISCDMVTYLNNRKVVL